jgi:prepilin-type processing-associated H-X9-DG protein
MYRNLTRWMVLALVLFAISVPATGAEEPAAAKVNSLARFVPADALLFLAYDGNNAACRKTALYEILTSPEMKEVFAGPLAALRKIAAKEAAKEGAPGPDIVLPLVNTRLAVAAVGLQMPQQQGEQPQPQVLVVIEVGKPDSPAAKAAALLLDNAQGALGIPPDAFQDAKIAGHTVKSATVGPMQVSYTTTADGHFVLGTAGALALSLDKVTTKLSANREFQRVSEISGGNEVFLLHYAHGAVMQKFGMFLMGNPALRRVLVGPGFGLQNVRTVTLAVAPDGRGFRGTAFIRSPGELQGLLKIVASKPLDPKVFELAPASCTFFAGRSCNVGELWDFIVNQVALAEPKAGEEYEEAMAKIRDALGVDLRNDLVGSLGTNFAVFGSPFAVVAEIKNRDKFNAAIQSMLTKLAQVAAKEERDFRGAELRLNSLKYAGHTITYVDGERLPMFVQPCYTMVGDFAVFGAFPASLKSYLLEMKSGTSILDNVDFKAARARVGAKPAGLYYADTRGFVGGVYTYLPMLVGLAKMAPPEFQALAPDAAKLPPAQEITSRLYGCSMALRKVEDGLLVECHSPVIVPTPPEVQYQSSIGTTAVLAGMLLPALGRARHEARKVKSMSNLSQIAKASMLWLLKHGGNEFYPPSLKELVDRGIIGDPRVFIHPAGHTKLKPGQFVSDYDSLMDRVGKKIAEKDVTAGTPMAWEKRPFAGGRNVAFFDGHVEWMTEGQFQRLMKKADEIVAKLKRGQ